MIDAFSPGLSRRALLSTSLALGAAACSKTVAQARRTQIQIAVVSSYVGKKLRLAGADYVIEQQGWLRDQLKQRGTALNWFPAPNAAVGPIINEAFANHQIQFANYSDLPSIILNASGSTVKTKMLVPGNPGDSYLAVPANSTAKTIEDLKGKRLAIHRGRPWELPLLRLLQSKGLSYADFQIYNINPDAGAAAVATGGVDGLFTVSAFNLEDKGVAKIIWSTRDMPLDWKSWGGFWGARDYLLQDPDTAQLIVTAYVKAVHWISHDENKETLIKLGTINGTPERIVRRNYDDSNISWKQRWSPLFQPGLYEHYRRAVAFAQENKIIRNPVDVDALLDDRMVKVALRQLKLEDYWAQPKTIAAATAAPTT